MKTATKTASEFISELRKISEYISGVEAKIEPAHEAWDNANVARMEAEAAEEPDQSLISILIAEENRLEAELMAMQDSGEVLDSIARELTFVIPWPQWRISEAILQLNSDEDTSHFIDAINSITAEDCCFLPDLSKFRR